MDNTRLFFTVDSTEDNEEIFDTLGKAEMFFKQIPTDYKPRLYIAIVRNAYQEENTAGDSWNYEDLNDTFEIVKQLK